jgi:phage gp29-like protein
MFRLFKRKPPVPKETAPQLARFERQTLSVPGRPVARLAYEVYDEMQLDSMVQTALTLKKLAVLAGDWEVRPADPTSAARLRAEFVDQAFDRMEGSVGGILEAAMDAFAKGWSVQEVVHRCEDGRLWLHSVRPKDPKLFGIVTDEFGRATGLRLRVPDQPERLLPREKFVVHIHRRTYGRPEGRSDLDAAYRHWQAKQSLLSAWRLHLEKFAMPTVLGKYQRGLPPEEQTAILRALQDIQNNAAVVFPGEIDVSLLGGSAEPTSGFLEAIDFHNREIARAIVGQTLTTDEGRRVGSLALGKVHLQVMMLQVAAIRRDLADAVMTEQVVRPLVEANFGPGKIPVFAFKETRVAAFETGKVE